MSPSRAESPGLRRYALLLTVLTATLFITGPAVCSNDARPLYSLGQTHAWMGAAVGILTLGLGVWIWRSKQSGWLLRLAAIAVAADIAESLLGLVADPQPPPVRVVHSFLGQLFFAVIVAITFLTIKRAPSPQPLENAGLLRFVAGATPVMVLLQIALGVVFRHGVLGVLPHILWAFVVAMFLVPVIAAIFGNRHSEIRRTGIPLMVIAFLQMLFGFALFILMSLDVDPAILIVITAIHTVVGALTLASAVVLTIVIRLAMATKAPPGNEACPA